MTGARITPVPNKPKTPTSTFRIPVELKQAAQTKAANEQPPRTLTDIVVQGLEQYVRQGEVMEYEAAVRSLELDAAIQRVEPWIEGRAETHVFGRQDIARIISELRAAGPEARVRALEEAADVAAAYSTDPGDNAGHIADILRERAREVGASNRA